MKKQWIIIIPLVLFDVLTKFLIKGKHIPLFRFFSLNATENTGIIFGMFKNNNQFWVIFTAFVLGVLLYLYHREKSLRFGLTFLIAGALGNLIDRLAYGFVIDFIDLTIWPVFNLADIYIVSGIILLLLHLRTKNL